MLVAKRPVSSNSVGVVCTGRMLGNPTAIPPMLGASYDFGWPKQILWRIGVDHCGEPTEPRHLGWTRPSMCSCTLVFPSDTAVNHSWSRLSYHAKKSLGCTCAGVVQVVCGTSRIHHCVSQSSLLLHVFFAIGSPVSSYCQDLVSMQGTSGTSTVQHVVPK